MAPQKKHKILIVDDHPIFCLGMSEMINKEKDLLVCGSVESIKETSEAIARLQPDLVVVEAIHCVLRGDIYASSTVKEKVFKRLTNQQTADSKSPLDILTNRELEVFRLIGEGFSTKEIANRLHLSIKTIGTYRENLKEKLKLKLNHFTGLVKFAVHWSNEMLR